MIGINIYHLVGFKGTSLDFYCNGILMGETGDKHGKMKSET